MTTTNRMLAVFIHALAVFLRRGTSSFTTGTGFQNVRFYRFDNLTLRTLHITVPAFFITLMTNASAMARTLGTVPRIIAHNLRVTNNFVIIINCTVIVGVVHTNTLVPFFFLNFIVTSFAGCGLINLNVLNAYLTVVCVRLGPHFRRSATPRTITGHRLTSSRLRKLWKEGCS